MGIVSSFGWLHLTWRLRLDQTGAADKNDYDSGQWRQTAEAHTNRLSAAR